MASKVAQSGWEIGLETHLKSASTVHHHFLASMATPEDVIAILQRAQKNARSGKTNKLLDVMHYYLHLGSSVDPDVAALSLLPACIRLNEYFEKNARGIYFKL